MDSSNRDSDDMLKPVVEAVPVQDEARPEVKSERAHRLAAALRQNLRRRKLPKQTQRPVDERN